MRWLGLALLFMATQVFAQVPGEPWEDYGESKVQEPFIDDSAYQWLYEALIPESTRTMYPEESFKSFRVHLRDSFEQFPAPELLKRVNLDKSSEIIGRITYAGIFPKEYHYSVTYDQAGEIVIAVRIHLRGLRQGEKATFAAHIREAQEIWNASRVKMDFAYSFRFELADQEEGAHFSVQVLDSTRGPYDRYWSRQWTGRVIAHEIGHMMGLGDEYKTISGVIDCLETSLMCQSWAGEPMDQHYYFILRRLMIPQGD